MSVAAVVPQPEAAETPFRALETALQRGATVLTPNQRTARHLLLRYDRAQAAAGHKTWQAPDILSWDAWMASLWRTAIVAGVEGRTLLNSVQEREIWRRIIDSGPAETLRPAASQAKLCEAASSLLGAYDVTGRYARGSYPLNALTADADRFAGWYARFEEQCRIEALLPASQLAIELADGLRRGRITPAREYLLYAFGPPTPAQALLIGSLTEAGAAVQSIAAAVERDAGPELAGCDGGSQELRRCALWVRRQLERNADASIAVIVPDLPAVRGELERELRRAVAPQRSDVTAGELTPMYEFSSGRALDSLAMVQDALRLLRWCAGPLSLDDAGALLRSPHLRLAASPVRGAELDMHTVRSMPALRGEVSIHDVIEELLSRDAATVAHLRDLQSAARPLLRERHGYAAFADAVRDLLRTAGWPGASPLSSEEHGAMDRWDETLDRVATLDLLGSRTTLDAFVATLSRAAKETMFAPENTGAPVQVMTPEEAAGGTADLLWFLHADENSWPPIQSLHPLLPWTLQRELRMPGADMRADEDASRESLAALLRSTGAAIFSYSRTTAEGTQRPSPLVMEVARTASSDDIPQEDTAMLTETHEDPELLPDLPAGLVAGGAKVLEAQAQCGFRAFAERRLFAGPIDPREAGFTAMERGDQVHKVLQMFWSQVQSQAELIRMSGTMTGAGQTERDALLRELIDGYPFGEEDAAWESAYIGVQRKRLFKLLSLWLDFEQTRPPFQVAHTEKAVQNAQLGPLHLSLRVDRIDHVDAGEAAGTILIDYKTGAATSSDWQGDRPDAPQLPVYAVAGGLGQVSGIAFGVVRVGKDMMKLDGNATSAKLLGKGNGDIKEPFETRLEHWQRDLLTLAEAFAAGDASVDPKEYPTTCDRCSQRMLCRVDAATLQQIEDPLDDEEEGGMPWK